jgi:hypothetical protein
MRPPLAAALVLLGLSHEPPEKQELIVLDHCFHLMDFVQITISV